MDLLSPSFQKSATLACLLAAAAQAGQPRFTAQDALRAEWDRRPPAFTAAQEARLGARDRARLRLSLQRIGAPGAPALLPPELAQPTLAQWEALAAQARTARERYDALFFLNRLKSPKALAALDGLTVAEARAWPRHLHLEGPVAAARVNGAEVSPALQAFLDELWQEGRIDPVRAQAATVRLTLAGREPGTPHLPLPPTLASLDAWNRGPWAARAKEHLALLGIALPPEPGAEPLPLGDTQRLLQGLPPEPLPEAEAAALRALDGPPLQVMAALEYLAKLPDLPALAQVEQRARALAPDSPLWSGYLAVLRKHAPAAATALDQTLLAGPDPLARSAAIEDLPNAPADLEALVRRLWSSAEYDGVQALLPALERWQVPQREALLRRFLQHPCWTARLDAYTLLVKVEPKTPWPEAPAPGPAEAAILKEAQRLLKAGRPVRLRLQFSRGRQVTLRLDPANAPINVANLALLARRGYFDHRRVPRVVPDFVVQMGSPVDTMDGGPGYTVRCEDSLHWYGPGSVGIALSGKDTGGSQFFITTNAAPHLTGRYTRVGEVEDPGRALPLLDQLELGAEILKVEVL